MNKVQNIQNPFAQSLSDFFKRLNIINGFLYQLQTRIIKHRDMVLDHHKNKDVDLERIFAGSSVPVCDLMADTPYYYASGGFSKSGREFLDFGLEIINAQAAWAVCQGYEAFETFLKDTIAILFYLCPDELTNSKIAKPEPFNIESCKKEVRKINSGKNNRVHFKLLRQKSDLSLYEDSNSISLKLKNWYEVISEVRHAVTHSNSMVKANIINGWPDIQLKLLGKYFLGEWVGNNYRLNIDFNSGKKCLELLASYGYLIFKSISISCSQEWDVIRK